MNHRRTLATCLVALALACPILTVAADNPNDDLASVLARFDATQESIHTLSAAFTETTTNPMLRDPISADGLFYMTKPDAIRWEYSTPEEMRFVIAQDQYTGYFPVQKRAERRNIKRWSERLFRFLGLGQGSEQLSQFYDIHLDDRENHPGADANTVVLLLEPKKRRARKRVQDVFFFLDNETFLPRRVEYRGKDGNSRVIDFREIQINPKFASNLYTVEIPDDVPVTAGFSGLPNMSSESSR